MPTLDEYRRKLVVRLEGCADVAQTKTLLAEADLWLTASRISDQGHAAFWQSVSQELALFADEVAVLRARQLASFLRKILATSASAPGCQHASRPIVLERKAAQRPASLEQRVAPESDDPRSLA